MNIHFIYEGNEYQFDLFSGVTINYIKELAEKIFQYEEKGLEILYNDEIISNFDDKIKICELVKNTDKVVIFRLEKKDIAFKNTIVSSNESTNDTNNNNVYYNCIKDKFFKFNKSYIKTIEEISSFEEKLNESLEKVRKQIKDLKIYILKINEQLNSYYNNNSYDKLISIFDENKTQGFTEKELKDLNKKIESLIQNYKYLITQNNFQINIIDYINEKKDFLKLIKIKLYKITNVNKYEDIINLLEHNFNEYFTNNVPKNLNVNDLDTLDNKYLHSFNKAFNSFNENKQNISFPKIRSFNSKQINKLLLDTEKINDGKKIKLVKKNKSDMNTHYKNLSLPSTNRNSKNSNNTESLLLNKLPILDSITIDSTINSDSKKTKSLKYQINNLNDLSDNNSKYKLNSKIKDLENSSLNYEVRPKIMEKNNKNIKSRNYQKIDNINSKTITSDYYNSYYEKKNNTNFPSLYDSIIKNKENAIENLSERNNKKNYKNLSNIDISIINKEKNNENDSIIDLKQIKSIEREKDIKSKFKPKNIENEIEKKIDDNINNKKKEEPKLIKSRTNEPSLLLKPHLSINDVQMILLRRKTDEKVLKLTNFAAVKSNFKKNELNNKEKNENKESFKKINLNSDDVNDKEKNIEKVLEKKKENDKEKKKEKEKKKDKKKEKKTLKEEEKLINSLKDEQLIKTLSKFSLKPESRKKVKEEEKLINVNRKENNKEQIEKLTKDLLVSKAKERIKVKNHSKENKDSIIIIKKNSEEDEEKSEEKNEEIKIDNSLNENINEDNNKKKKKKQINIYDFII